MKESLFYIKKEQSDEIRCTLCPKACYVKEGDYGYCLARKNINGKFYLQTYGKITSMALDPIEKKPLYKFMPGSNILSIGMYGCNMNCPFCQNHTIAKERAIVKDISVDEIIKTAQSLKKYKNIGVAYTYNEPLIGYEFVLDCSKAIRKAEMKNVLVSNGMISQKPLVDLLPFIDAANIDLKCYNKERYKKVLEGNLDVVKNNIRIIHNMNVHLEITMLIVPDLNDRQDEFINAVNFIADISPDIPLHISRYYPARKYDKLPPDINKLNDMKNLALNRLNCVFLGNV